MKLTFLGATQTVTGSKYLIEHEKKKFLIDCGLFQGKKELRLRNWDHPPVDPGKIDAILLTHAHLDHSGYIPKMVARGYEGPIYCSEATYDLCKILLPDSGHIQEEDAERANRYGYTKHHPALPLYTEAQARKSLQYFQPLPFGKPHFLTEEVGFELYRMGHILGAAAIRISNSDRSILFSGDIGRLHNPVMKPPVKIQEADYLVIESTYGNKLHHKDDPTEDIGRIIRDTAARGGTVVIPAFAVGRTQEILYYLHILKSEKRIPNIPIYLDSPMAINATGLMHKYINDHRLSEEECAEVCSIARYLHTAQDSKSLNTNTMPKVIISASGMATGGRVLHHLKHYLGDARNTVLFAGFQAPGTRGDRLVSGEQEIKIHGQMWPVKAQIENLHNVSAHADYEEILTWLENFHTPPRKVFITHGEPAAALGMKKRIEEKFKWNVVIPEYKQSEAL